MIKIAQFVLSITLPPSHYHIFYLIVSEGNSDLAEGPCPLWLWVDTVDIFFCKILLIKFMHSDTVELIKY